MIQVDKIWTTDTAVWIHTTDGREACEKFADYPRLKAATTQQRNNYKTDDFGIRWEDIDEDLSFEGFFEEKERTRLYKIFMENPVLNASAIARRMGMKQSLLAAYISGTKKLSPERERAILDVIKQIGAELLQLTA
ncbi:MAG: hypothetical protein H6Q17_583 [Bacteroidetes bacterium]|nr:hypothetical protein [Bacteroidota bacterium]